jgi:hypothetical protein
LGIFGLHRKPRRLPFNAILISQQAPPVTQPTTPHLFLTGISVGRGFCCVTRDGILVSGLRACFQPGSAAHGFEGRVDSL